ncbi:MAG: hypothetical protein ACR2N3_12115 [Pyrinomonadaceae bacterium]
MPSVSIISGVLLILLGIFGYAFSLIDGHASLTALIPAAFGILLVIFGAFAKSKENLRKHLMHAAILVALVGFLIPAARVLLNLVAALDVISPPLASSESAVIGAMGGKIISLAILSQVAMALICLVFVILSVKSFINARRNRVV